MKTLYLHNIKSSLIIPVLCLFTLNANSQNLVWEKTYGSTGYDGAHAMTITSDEKIVLAGFASYSGFEQALLMKTDSAGTEIWSKTFFTSGTDTRGADIKQTVDGGFILTGRTNDQAFLLKTDSSGNYQWDNLYIYPGGQDSRGHAVFQTSDSGYVVAGQVWTIHGAFGNYDMFVFKTDKYGSVEWMNIYYYQNEDADVALGVQQLSDGGYIIGGFTQSIWASYVIRTDSQGNEIWSDLYPGPWQSECYDIQATPDNGFIMTGIITSFTTDGDLFITKLDSVGNVIWDKVYGTVENEMGESIHQLSDGGFLITGMAVRGAGTGSYDLWVVRTDYLGDTLWTRNVGGTGDDRGFAGMKAQSGSIYAAGWNWSTGLGQGDIYLVKFADLITSIDTNDNTAAGFSLSQNYPNPFDNETKIDYEMPVSAFVSLKLFDVTGREVAVLLNQNQSAGKHTFILDASDLESGLYFYQLKAGDFIETKRIIKWD